MITSQPHLRLAALAPAGSGEDPFAMFAGWDTGQLLVLAALVPVAIFVFWYGSKQFSRQRGASSLRPKGRPFFGDATQAEHDATWRATVRKLDELPPTPIAKAVAGPVRIEATITAASGNLGGEPGRECVWRNRAGARSDSAIAAEVIFVGDASGRCGVENVEQARVIAPAESHGHHWESVSLYLGDRVEIAGHFVPERTGDDPDPTQLVYGTLGSEGRLKVRLLSRPGPHREPDSDPNPDPEEPRPS